VECGQAGELEASSDRGTRERVIQEEENEFAKKVTLKETLLL